MKRLVIFVALAFLMAACNVLPPATITPQPRATNTLRVPDDVPTPSTCGNKVCESPWENPWTCPDDCPKPTSAPSAIPSPKPPLPPTSGEGPYFHQVYSASSRDGLNWTHDNRMLLDHASVSAAIVTPEGKIRIYYVDASGAREGRSENVNCAESSDGGATFRVLNCTIANRAGDKAVDPSIVRLPDGRYRLYYYAVTGKMDATSANAIYSAISTDGVRFTQEQKVFEYPGVVDPDVFWTGKDWLMYVFTLKEGRTIIARSSDGLSFEYVGPLDPRNWGTTAPVKLDDGRFRLYAFKQPEMDIVGSFVSSDALNWTQESGTRLTARSGESITDPFVVRLPDGTWKMFFKIERRDAPRGTPGTPPSPPGDAQTERPCLPEKRTIAIPDAEGPSHHQVLLAKSADGSTWQTDNRVIIDQASVPEGLRMSDGRLLIYAVDGSGLGGPGLVYAESKDEGKTWTCGKINLQGADPDVVVLPDGRLRLYFIEFPFGPNPPIPGSSQANQPNRVRSAISSDGKTFAVEDGVRLEGIQYTDPDVIRIGNEWLMYVSTGMTAWAAQSSDGLAFKLIGKVNETGAVSGSFVFPNGTIRHYFCGRGGILSATSADGKSVWKQESGVRIGQTQNVKTVCDPSVLSDGKSGYWMVYKIQPTQIGR